MRTHILLASCLLAVITGCAGGSKPGSSEQAAETRTQLPDSSGFVRELDGKQVRLFYLKNRNGLEMAVTNYGAKVVSLLVPDRDGNLEDIVLGFDDLDGYLKANEPYFGAAIGRYGNRIAGGTFTLGGRKYTLATNNGKNHLHGGRKGFNAHVWDTRQPDDHTLVFSRISPEGEEGYPGNLKVTMVYTLTDRNEFRVTYEAETDRTTVINLTHHSFFNLHGAGQGTVNDHILQINASRYTPVDETLIPTGRIEPVRGTPMDFTRPAEIGSRIGADFEQLRFGNGYDHNWVLDRADGTLRHAATAWEPKSGRVMEVWTTEPGLQFYGGNFLDGKDQGKGGTPYEFRTAFCLETQHFPDSPNQPAFPSTVLKPGDTYTHEAVYKFSIK